MIKLEPKVAVWELTLACNSYCVHCGSDAKNPRADELTTRESLDLVSELAELGFKLIVLSGGEPTLKKGWEKIAERVSEKGVNLGIISNALAWTDKTIDTIASLNPYSVGFSVDGEEELHDYLRGVKGSHRKVFDAMRELKKREVTVCAISSVNKKNLKQLPLMRNRLIVYEADAWQLQVAAPMGRMSEKSSLVLDYEGYYKFAEFIAETRELLPDMNVCAGHCVGYFGALENKLRNKEWEGCIAGIKGIGIDSDGSIRGCLSIRSDDAIEGNIRNISLKDIWFNKQNFKYTRQFNKSDLKGICKDCENGAKCRGGCQSSSVAFFNNFHQAPYCLFNNEHYGKKRD